MKSWLKNWFGALDSLIFARRTACPLCEKIPCEIGLPGCWSCVTRLELCWRPLHAGKYLCFCLGVHQGQLKEHVADLKYRGQITTGHLLGELMGAAAREEPNLAAIQALIPMPLHPLRERERGYNQSLVLAQGIQSQWPKPIWDLLVRHKATKPQARLSPRERWRNTQDAFALVHPQQVRGRRVALIDDVLTTGATFLEAAAVIAAFGGHPCGIFTASGRRH